MQHIDTQEKQSEFKNYLENSPRIVRKRPNLGPDRIWLR